MFWMRYTTQEGTTETAFSIPPQHVDYPEKRLYTLTPTPDGAAIIQRPLQDNRVRSWTWKGYGPRIPACMTQWALLESLEARARMQDGLPSSVEIWEDVSGVGGFDRTDANGNRVYTQVKILQANRSPRQGGGPVMYESVLEFVITDPSYTTF